MQQADYHRHRPTPWMQESVSMHKNPTPLRHSRMNQVRSEEEEKERKTDRKDRGQEADGNKDSPTKQKHIGVTMEYQYIDIATRWILNKRPSVVVIRFEMNEFSS